MTKTRTSKHFQNMSELIIGIVCTVIGGVIGAILLAVVRNKNQEARDKLIQTSAHDAGEDEGRKAGHKAGYSEGYTMGHDAGYAVGRNQAFGEVPSYKILPKGRHEVLSTTPVGKETLAVIRIVTKESVPNSSNTPYPPLAVVRLDTKRTIPSVPYSIVMDDDGLNLEVAGTP